MQDKIDKFLTRYGAKPGRCNAICKSGKPCHRWPCNGHPRCHRHGAGYTRGRVLQCTRNASGRFCKSDGLEQIKNT